MAIQPSTHAAAPASKVVGSSLVRPEAQEQEATIEVALRPATLEEYIGQTQIKKHLRIAIDSAKIRREPLEHILFY